MFKSRKKTFTKKKCKRRKQMFKSRKIKLIPIRKQLMNTKKISKNKKLKKLYKLF